MRVPPGYSREALFFVVNCGLMPLARYACMRCIYFVLLITLSLAAKAQESATVHHLRTYFNSASDEMSWQAEHELDSVFKLLRTHRALYDVELRGFSDRQGRKKANIQLAQQRCERIAEYLAKNGFAAGRIHIRNAQIDPQAPRGAHAPSRRVEVAFSLDRPTPFFRVGEQAPGLKFTVDASRGAAIELPDSMGIVVPPEAFMNADSSLVTGKVELRYTLYQSREAYLNRRRRLNYTHITRHEIDLFMEPSLLFELRAYKNGREVQLMPQKNLIIGIRVPVTNYAQNLYHQPDSADAWFFQQPLFDKNGYYVANVPPCGTRTGQHCGSLVRFDRMALVATTGLHFASDSISVLDAAKRLDKLNKQATDILRHQFAAVDSSLHDNAWLLRAANEQVRLVDSVVYRVERVRTAKRSTTFRLLGTNPAVNEAAQLKGIAFKTKEPLPDSLFKVDWEACKVTVRKNNRANLELRKGGSKLKLRDMPVKYVKPKTTKTARYQLYRNYKKQLKARLTLAEKRIATRDSIAAICHQAQLQLDSLLALEDSIQATLYRELLAQLKCLRQLEGEYGIFTPNDTSLLAWARWFDAHKPQKAAQYRAVERDLKLRDADYLPVVQARSSMAERLRPTIHKRTVQPAALGDTVGIGVAINQLGLFSAGHEFGLRRYHDGVPPKREFVVTVGKYTFNMVEKPVASVLLLRPQLNGFLQFDGTHCFSPYNLPFHWKTYLLLATDSKGVVYFATLELANNQTAVNEIVLRKFDTALGRQEVFQQFFETHESVPDGTAE